MHPVGPLNPTVYWVRRVSIVVLAVAVLIGGVWYLASRSSRSSAGQQPVQAAVTGSAAPTLTGVLAASTAVTTPATSGIGSSVSGSAVSSGRPPSAVKPSGPAVAASGTAKSGASAATSPAATSSPASAAPVSAAAPAPGAPATAATAPKPPAKTTPQATSKAAPKSPPAPAPKSPPAPAPSYAPDGMLLCPDAVVAVVAISTEPSFTRGSQPTLGMTVTNTGAVPCRRDVSGTLQTFTVRSADGKRVWSTADCFPGEGTEVRDFAPGEAMRYKIKWSGRTSSPGCTGDRAQAPAGKYVVIAQLGKLSSKPAAFTITG